jgi:hypothetical protein
MESERVDSTALGSPSIELDADVPPAAPGADISEGDYSGVRKVVRKQKLDSKEYSASDLAAVLRQRKQAMHTGMRALTPTTIAWGTKCL